MIDKYYTENHDISFSAFCYINWIKKKEFRTKRPIHFTKHIRPNT